MLVSEIEKRTVHIIHTVCEDSDELFTTIAACPDIDDANDIMDDITKAIELLQGWDIYGVPLERIRLTPAILEMEQPDPK